MRNVDLALEFLAICEDDGCETAKDLREALELWALCEEYGCTDPVQLERLLVAWKHE